MRSKVIGVLTVLCLGFGAGECLAQAPFSVPPAPIKQAPNAYGLLGDTYVTIGEWEFTPAVSSWTWSDTGGNQPLKYSTQASIFFNAPVHVPTGALITYLEFDYCDDNATQDISVQLVALDNLNNALFVLGSVASSGQPGCTTGSVDVSGFGIIANNDTQRWVLQTSFGTNADSTTRFAGAKVGYRLTVSPAPGSPTFNDVPMSDGAFQYIEALVASGITAGCGGGDYCPDQAVTRRQMAVFLAKALGLYWQH